MNLLGLLSQLGSALVSLGLGGPGDQEREAIPCPEVRAAADAHTIVEVTAESHTVVQVTTDC
ncbi:hypothetical protein WMF30_40080 [Sorangium sp. So ce134]